MLKNRFSLCVSLRVVCGEILGGCPICLVVPFVGTLYLADIGVPPALYAQPGLNLKVGPLFARSGILRAPDPSASDDRA
jgi:hypothetical protein